MKNLLDVKSFVIGFLLCLCVVLFMGFGGGSDSGRYVRFGNWKAVIDTETGRIRPMIKDGSNLLDTPFDELPLDTKRSTGRKTPPDEIIHLDEVFKP